MQSTLVVAIYLTCLALALMGAVAAARNRTTGLVVLATSVAVELLLLTQVVVAGWRLVGGTRPAELATFIGYLAGVVFVLPVAVAWSLAERSRWNGVVVAVGAITVAVMTARLQVLWRTVGG